MHLTAIWCRNNEKEMHLEVFQFLSIFLACSTKECLKSFLYHRTHLFTLFPRPDPYCTHQKNFVCIEVISQSFIGFMINPNCWVLSCKLFCIIFISFLAFVPAYFFFDLLSLWQFLIMLLEKKLWEIDTESYLFFRKFWARFSAWPKNGAVKANKLLIWCLLTL